MVVSIRVRQRRRSTILCHYVQRVLILPRAVKTVFICRYETRGRVEQKWAAVLAVTAKWVRYLQNPTRLNSDNKYQYNQNVKTSDENVWPLSLWGLKPIKLAYELSLKQPAHLKGSSFNRIGQYAKGLGDRAYHYVELAISSQAVAMTIANIHCTNDERMTNIISWRWQLWLCCCNLHYTTHVVIRRREILVNGRHINNFISSSGVVRHCCWVIAVHVCTLEPRSFVIHIQNVDSQPGNRDQVVRRSGTSLTQADIKSDKHKLTSLRFVIILQWVIDNFFHCSLSRHLVSTIPIHIMNICGKIHWHSFTYFRDTVSCGKVLMHRQTDRQPENTTYCW